MPTTSNTALAIIQLGTTWIDLLLCSNSLSQHDENTCSTSSSVMPHSQASPIFIFTVFWKHTWCRWMQTDKWCPLSLS